MQGDSQIILVSQPDRFEIGQGMPAGGGAENAWCAAGEAAEWWDGVDLSACFKARVLTGYLPLLFLTLSILSLSLYLLHRLSLRFRSSKPPLVLKFRPRASSTASAASFEISLKGPRAIKDAENEVIMGVMKEESLDLGRKQLEKLGIVWDEEEDDEEDDAREHAEVGQGGVGRALWECRDDLIALGCAGGIFVLLGMRYLDARRAELEGSDWAIFELLAWAWTTLLLLPVFLLSFSSSLKRLRDPSIPHRLTSLQQQLQFHLIPWILVYSLVSFFDLRSVLISANWVDLWPLTVADARSLGIFILSWTLLALALFTRRASPFSPLPLATSTTSESLPPSPELNMTLYSLLTFTFLSPFMYRAAFPSFYDPTHPSFKLAMSTVPDLRSDDKTARVLLSYRRSCAALSPKWSLTVRLLYHFQKELWQQQGWSYLRVTVVALPPLFLRGLLAHVGRRSRGEEAPMHVALLYAAAMFFFQIVASISASQALYVGRRVCIRLRSIIIAEVFTKALRKKDMAGTSSAEGSEAKESRPTTKEEQEDQIEKASSGKILNLISVDATRVSEICAYLHFLFPELPVTMAVTIYLLFLVLGLSALAGLTVLILITPLQAYASKLFHYYQKSLLAAADARLSLATEVIGAVKLIKYFAWEQKFLEKMEETRKKELEALWSRAVTFVYSGVLMFGAPVMVSVATFVFHTKVLHRELTAEIAFTSLALFNILRGPLEGFTDMIVNVLQAHVSLNRIDAFLKEQETEKYVYVNQSTSANDPLVGFVGGSFTWSDENLAREDESLFRIKGLDLEFPTGKLSIVLGPVGSGKSTLLLSLLGETNRLSGHSYLPSPVVRAVGENPKFLTETTAYCSQTPWLLSDTIKANILFGSELNEKRYRDVIEACALDIDLRSLELADETEVGEKGTVLSGGQKARICLARAIYSPAKYVLLDDVLSAVDSHTGQHLYEKCLKGPLMRHRTCILVTHAVDLCLPGAAFIVSMDNGAVVSSGAPDQIDRSTLALSTSAKQASPSDKETEAEAMASTFTIEALAAGETDEVVRTKAEAEKRARLKLVKDETQSEGAVSAQVYLLYLKAMGGWWLAGVSLGIFLVAQLSEIGVSLALRYWAGSYDDQDTIGTLFVSTVHSSLNRWTSCLSSAASVWLASSSSLNFGTGNATTDYWLKVYCGLVLVNLVFYALRIAFFLRRGVIASQVIYVRLIERILSARTRFFDSTPTGRILNRLSKDIETIDQELAPVAMFLLLEFLGVIGIIGSISVVLPAFLFAAVIITAVYFGIGFVYLASSRELKRFESVSRSPIFSLFGETLNGVATIRAYGDSARFAKQVFSLLNITNRPFFTLWQGNRWLSVRIDFAGSLVTFAAALFVLFAVNMDAALAGFILSFAIAFNERILWVVRLWSVMEINFNSVERVREYLEIDQEDQGGQSPPAIWPSRDGSIEVEGLTAAYSPDLPPVLHDVSFKVLPREKIGICGRTGSGKSTLGLSFFRFIEPTSGRIVIDGLDISTLKLSDLRSRLTIVAQESALFAGSLRFNLDPFDVYDDAALWDALRRVQMAAPVSETSSPTPASSRAASIRAGGKTAESDSGRTARDDADRYVVKSLEMVVLESGKNFSAGQRQLLALARGILKLRNSSILILDESTASLDHATDERIQQTIREEMQDATILCIAHRLRTIVDYDRILVLGEGQVLEYASPWTLLDDETSAFSELCRKSGEFDDLKKLAEEARERSKRDN